MVQAVTEDMIDVSVLAGTTDEVHYQLEPYTGLFDTLLLFCPTLGLDAEETKTSSDALIEAVVG